MSGKDTDFCIYCKGVYEKSGLDKKKLCFHCREYLKHNPYIRVKGVHY